MASKKALFANTRTAWSLIILFGVVSLFADMNYEGGRSVVGQYLKLLGTTAFALGLAAGLGELIGYALRFVSGFLVDKTKAYWPFLLVGYAVGLSALPLMAFVESWQAALVLVLMERLGKAIRKPASDALLSFASSQTGRGIAFGLHEAMDQIGAVLGPALLALILFLRSSTNALDNYRLGLLLLFLPAALALLLVLVGKLVFPKPEKLEPPQVNLGWEGFSLKFWLLVGASGLLAAGITDFPLIGLHLKKTEILTEALIPLLYTTAMAVDAAAALVFGWIFDRFGPKTLWVLFASELLTAPLIFLGEPAWVFVGMALWGISVGTQESLLKAALAQLVGPENRARAYGLFSLVFGSAWFLGSTALGLLYDGWGPMALVVLSVVLQTLALGAFLLFLRIKVDSTPVSKHI